MVKRGTEQADVMHVCRQLVGCNEVHEVKAFAALHGHRLVGANGVFAAVVGVHVQVGRPPAAGMGVEPSHQFCDDGHFSTRLNQRIHLEGRELDATQRAHDVLARGHHYLEVAAVRVAAAVHVPLAHPAAREVRGTIWGDDRPAAG